MLIKKEMVPAANLYAAGKGDAFTDISEWLMAKLNKAEKKRYAKAMIKVDGQVTLSRKDLVLFDKIDVLTFVHHGMCLRDSLVTKARIKACKKYSVQFTDRDGLVEHMHLIEEIHQIGKVDHICSEAEIFDIFLSSRLGADKYHQFLQAISNILTNTDLTRANLEVLKEADSYMVSSFKGTIIHSRILEAINSACNQLKINFNDLSFATKH